MTIIRNKTNPNSAKMQKHDVYKTVPYVGRQVMFENVRSGHRVNGIIAGAWVKKGIASLV